MAASLPQVFLRSVNDCLLQCMILMEFNRNCPQRPPPRSMLVYITEQDARYWDRRANGRQTSSCLINYMYLEPPAPGDWHSTTLCFRKEYLYPVSCLDSGLQLCSGAQQSAGQGSCIPGAASHPQWTQASELKSQVSLWSIGTLLGAWLRASNPAQGTNCSPPSSPSSGLFWNNVTL